MDAYISIPLDEARRVFELLEKLHELMHQPLVYRDIRQVENFVEHNYAEVRDLYYQVVWRWLPEEVHQEIENR